MYKCKCNNIGSPHCFYKYCRNCCDGINCNLHEYKTKECICKETYFNKLCLDKKCRKCCNNKKCNEHFILCKCTKKVIKKDLCNTNSCSGRCCNDSHCTYHFDTDHELTNKDFIWRKTVLGSKRIIPTEIINIIIDEYLDNRLKCIVCDHKFVDIENDISYGFACVCYICNNWVCEICYLRKVINATCETFCMLCDDKYSDSDYDFTDDVSDNDSDNDILII
jgi:hypothetical protein